MNLIFTNARNYWGTGKKGAQNASLLAALLILAIPALLTGCSGGDAPAPAGAVDASTTNTTTGLGSNDISVRASQASVNSDGSDFSTITATVSKLNITQSDATVTFSTTCGLLSSASQVSDINGESITTFKSNPANPANQSCTITATSGTSSNTIPVTISGTTVTLSVDKGSIPSGGTATLTISVKNAGGVGIHNAPVSIISNNGIVTAMPANGTTVNGALEVTLNAGSTPGASQITVYSMGAEATLDFTVISAATTITITSPASPTTIVTSIPQDITVTGNPGKVVRFVTTLGTWNGGGTIEDQTLVGGTATRSLTSTAVGLATVQVYEVDNPTNSDSIFAYVTPPHSEVAQVTISFSESNVDPSSDTLINSITVYAKVTTLTNQPVANVPVNFSFPGLTGSYGSLSPAISLTDTSGYAFTTFYAGKESSGGLGVLIRATEQGSGGSYYDEDSVIIGGTPVSIALTRSTTAAKGSPDTYYVLDMSVLVTDSKGAAMPNIDVSLSAWPTRYRLGYVTDPPAVCAHVLQKVPGTLPDPLADPPIVGDPYAGQWSVPNEDGNKDTYYSAAEDVGPCDDLEDCSSLTADGVLTPHSAASGAVPASVKTGENGIGSFQLTYLKSSAVWIEDLITAKVKVLGTESQATLTTWLPYIIGEECFLPDSPYGYY